METYESRAAEVEWEGPLHCVRAERGVGGWWSLWLMGKMAPRRHSFGWSCSYSVQPRASVVYDTENPQLQTHFFISPEGVRELPKAGILRKCSWGQRVERNLITLCIKHDIIQYVNRCRDIHSIRISRGVFCFALYFPPYVLVGYLF